MSNVAPLITELSQALGAVSNTLNFSYASLDPISRHVEVIGTDSACETLYDHSWRMLVKWSG